MGIRTYRPDTGQANLCKVTRKSRASFFRALARFRVEAKGGLTPAR
jgi:hypothetical protein